MLERAASAPGKSITERAGLRVGLELRAAPRETGSQQSVGDRAARVIR